ncbi:unnamed protein product [Adineta ricciae]|uniref:TLDc domain-containing protein n=1 Tax=Adineta ricciae TaxID=249248 RepID=A0A814FQI4_ADIRI|nr:unnamed protein product [Adineta ricciae]CAF0986155.1 unnamed protein product [Adineta ricciae]
MSSKTQLDSFVLSALTCPITLELFTDPVVADDGHTYERSAIVEWIKNHHETSPMTRQTIKLKNLKPNNVVKQLADQYRSSSTSNVSTDLVIFYGGGTLLNKQQRLLINDLFYKPKKWLLIYKATRDGFGSGDFHNHCNSRGATLTLIQTRSRFSRKKHPTIFGGYTTIPWSSRYAFYTDPQAFLFLLNRNELTRFSLGSQEEVAVSHNISAGPIFGFDDIHICHRANENSFSYSKFPNSYADSKKDGLGRKTFSKTKFFSVAEIEVYKVVT